MSRDRVEGAVAWGRRRPRLAVPAFFAMVVVALLSPSSASAWDVASANGVVHVTNVHINGGGSQAKVAAGSTVQVTFSYALNDPCFTCVDQLEVGWSDQGPRRCVFDGPTPTAGTASFSLTAPSKVGEYYIAVDQGGDSSCGATLPVPGPTWWNGNPPDPDTRLIGRVGVKTTADSFHLESGGKVGGLVRISRVHINGGGNQATVSPGSDVVVSMEYFIDDTACTTCLDEIVVGLANDTSPAACIYFGTPGAVGVSASSSAHFAAPTTAGSYFIAFDRSQSSSGCPTAWWTSAHPEANPSSGKRGDTQFIGHLTVT